MQLVHVVFGENTMFLAALLARKSRRGLYTTAGRSVPTTAADSSQCRSWHSKRLSTCSRVLTNSNGALRGFRYEHDGVVPNGWIVSLPS
jgi:hypothetical protein